MIFALVLLLCAGSFAGGVVLVKKRRREIPILLAVCAAAIAFRIVLIYSRPLDVRLFPFDAYPAVEWWWVAPFVFFLFGAGAGRIQSMWLRDTLLVAQGLMFLYFCLMAWGESFTPIDHLRGEVSRAGLCLQTGSFSCGAASASAFLHSYGIESNEREMAYLGHTTQFFGTSLAGMMRGLSKKLPPGRSSLRVERMTIEELAALGRPALVIVKSKIVDHWIVVDGVGDREVRVRDPSVMASKTMSRPAFEERWVGLAVWTTWESKAAAPR